MYIWWKEKKIVFLYKEKKKDFSLRIYVQKDWLRDHTSCALCGIEIMIKGILNCFGFEFHNIKVRFLFFILEFKVTCYLSWMKFIHDCCFRCVFCMRCKTRFSNKRYQSSLQYHVCITCDWVLESKKIVFLVI